MRVRATASSLLIATLFCVAAAIPAAAQEKQPTHWDGKAPSPADLHKILEQHDLWLTSGMKSGVRADLSGADLFGADLSRAGLSGAHLSNANLSGADLSGAGLIGADLRGAHLNFANLSRTSLNSADLIRADLSDADLSGAHLYEADLSRAFFEPRKLPEPEEIAYARGLELMTRGASASRSAR